MWQVAWKRRTSSGLGRERSWAFYLFILFRRAFYLFIILFFIVIIVGKGAAAMTPSDHLHLGHPFPDVPCDVVALHCSQIFKISSSTGEDEPVHHLAEGCIPPGLSDGGLLGDSELAGSRVLEHPASVTPIVDDLVDVVLDLDRVPVFGVDVRREDGHRVVWAP